MAAGFVSSPRDWMFSGKCTRVLVQKYCLRSMRDIFVDYLFRMLLSASLASCKGVGSLVLLKAIPAGSVWGSQRMSVGLLQVLPCSKRSCHDWQQCPYAHPGEKAKRRDPRVHTYTGIACPNMKQASSNIPLRIC